MMKSISNSIRNPLFAYWHTMAHCTNENVFWKITDIRNNIWDIVDNIEIDTTIVKHIHSQIEETIWV